MPDTIQRDAHNPHDVTTQAGDRIRYLWRESRGTLAIYVPSSSGARLVYELTPEEIQAQCNTMHDYKHRAICAEPL